MTTLENARDWARGNYPTEAGVELLARSGLLYERAPWLREGRVDVETLLDESGVLSGGEQRIVRIAASLLGGPPVNLADNLPGLDRRGVNLVLAALAHAAGSHEGSELVYEDDGAFVGLRPVGTLHAWPEG